MLWGVLSGKMDTTQLILLLSSVPGIGEHTLARLLRRNAVLRRSPEELLALNPTSLMRDYELRQEVAERVAGLTASQRRHAEEMARQMHRTGVQVITFLDAAYPPRLLHRMKELPPVLYVFGNLNLLSQPLFAIANSNGASEEVLSYGDVVARVAIECGWIPITGHNRVPYQRPALVARRNSKPVCYVLDRGILEAFGSDLSKDLFAAARIWNPIYDPSCDLTLSPFPMTAHMIAANNRRRDAIIFALADAVFVGDVRPGGRMEEACLSAQVQGTPVFVMVPESLQSKRLKDAGAPPLDVSDADGFAALLRQMKEEVEEKCLNEAPALPCQRPSGSL